jgi:NAD(P)-dependent dehydrogenase (short-subunit alcohol dehydrogenase family)
MNDSDGDGKAVLVTGASSGIGDATARMLAADGWRVFAGMHHRGDAGEPPAPEITSLPLDVTSAEAIAAAIEAIGEATGGRLDALVNNAGIPGAGPVEAVPVETFRDVVETNLIGTFAVTQACLPMLRAAAGRVVIVSSLGGRVAFPYASAYHASKFGVEGLADSLRAEVRPLDVDVVVVEPASMATAIWEKGRSSLVETRERMTDEQTEIYGSDLDTFDERLSAAEDSEDPREVASAILEAVTTRSPSERYPVGRGARTLASLRPLIPDALFDRLARTVTGGA